MKKISALLILLILCGQAAGPKQLPPGVSIIQLIDYQHAIVPNAVWFERNPSIMADSERLDMNYVEIVGTFTTDTIGFGLGRPGVGGIKNIRSAVLQSELKHPIAERFANTHKKH